MLFVRRNMFMFMLCVIIRTTTYDMHLQTLKIQPGTATLSHVQAWYCTKACQNWHMKVHVTSCIAYEVRTN
jgi:hypothetical protein